MGFDHLITKIKNGNEEAVGLLGVNENRGKCLSFFENQHLSSREKMFLLLEKHE